MNQIVQELKEIQFKKDNEKFTPQYIDVIGENTMGKCSLFDSVPLGLYRIDVEGNFLDINHTMVSILRAPNVAVLRTENYFSLFKDEDQKKNW
jgi:PAS domain-containing protein